MEYRKIQAAGPEFSRIIAGAWRWHTVAGETVDTLVRTSLDCGITTFDHADIYGDHGNEEIFGRVLRAAPSLRQGMQLVTKFGIRFPSDKRPNTWVKHYDTSVEHATWSVENSLRMLNTDHLDLLLIHRPDPLLDPEVVAKAFDQLRASGKVLHFGVSNFTPHQFEMLQSYLSFPLVTNQVEISLTYTKPLFDGTLDVLLKHRVSPMAWSPLGGGALMEGGADLFHKAADYNATYSQMALAWLLSHPSGIFPVVGTTKPERLQDAAGALNVKLDRQDWFEMLKVATGNDVP